MRFTTYPQDYPQKEWKFLIKKIDNFYDLKNLILSQVSQFLLRGIAIFGSDHAQKSFSETQPHGDQDE